MKKKSYILFVLILATICLGAYGNKEPVEKQMDVYITTDTGCYSTTLEDMK